MLAELILKVSLSMIQYLPQTLIFLEAIIIFLPLIPKCDWIIVLSPTITLLMIIFSLIIESYFPLKYLYLIIIEINYLAMNEVNLSFHLMNLLLLTIVICKIQFERRANY